MTSPNADVCPCGTPITPKHGLAYQTPHDPHAKRIRVCSAACLARVVEAKGDIVKWQLTEKRG